MSKAVKCPRCKQWYNRKYATAECPHARPPRAERVERAMTVEARDATGDYKFDVKAPIRATPIDPRNVVTKESLSELQEKFRPWHPGKPLIRD